MRISKFLSTGILIVVSLYVFGQKSSTVMPVDKKIRFQSATSYGYKNGGYWSYITNSDKPLVQLHGIADSTNCLFVLKESSERGFYEIFTGDVNGTMLGLLEDGKLVNQFAFHHIYNGLFKIYDSNGRVICRKDDGEIGFCADGNSAETCWYLTDDTSTLLIYENDTLIVKQPRRKRSEFYAQIRANYYQYGTKVPMFFERLTFLDLVGREYGEIALALNDCISIMDQAERTLLVLKGMSKNSDKYARRYVYRELEKVDFRKPNLVSKATIERYFTENEQETDPELVGMVKRIKSKMLRGLTFRIR
ncbi:MAG: hypothetical protein AB7S48_16340 [Bacteroidales bacterium]